MPKVTAKKPRANTVPYVKGFKPPTQRQKLSAISHGKENIPSDFQPGEGFWNSIPKCTSIDDWLAQYDEEGQTFEDYLQQSTWLSNRKLKYMSQEFRKEGRNLPEKYPNGAIYVLPLGDFDCSNSPNFDDLVEYAQLFFKLPVKKHPNVKLEFSGKHTYWVQSVDGVENHIKLNSRFNAESGHRQLQVDLQLATLRQYMPEDGLCMIALTMSDLFADKPDLFVAGMAAGNHRVAIFSLYRYDPNLEFSMEFWYDMQLKKKCNKSERKKEIMRRSCRLLVHELAHLLSVGHCIYFTCCMNGSGHLQEDFTQPMHLCPLDLRKLQRLTGFDVIERYRGLKDFYEKHKLIDEAQWVERRIEFIENQKAQSTGAAK